MKTLVIALLLALSVAHAAAAGTLPAPVDAIRQALRAGDTDRATDAADRAVERLAGDAQAWWWAGRAYGRKAMSVNMLFAARWATRTREAFEQAVALDPDHVRARYDLLEFYLAAPPIVGGGRDKADAQAAAIASRNASMGKLAAARLARADDAPDRAEALLAEALALDPDNAPARSSLAALATEREDWARVREIWRGQLERPESDDFIEQHALARYQLARTAAISGDELADGLAMIDRFIADAELPSPLTLASAQWRRGQILDRLGRRDEAIAALRLAIDDENVGEQAEDDLDRLLDAG